MRACVCVCVGVRARGRAWGAGVCRARFVDWFLPGSYPVLISTTDP